MQPVDLHRLALDVARLLDLGFELGEFASRQRHRRERRIPRQQVGGGDLVAAQPLDQALAGPAGAVDPPPPRRQQAPFLVAHGVGRGGVDEPEPLAEQGQAAVGVVVAQQQTELARLVNIRYGSVGFTRHRSSTMTPR